MNVSPASKPFKEDMKMKSLTQSAKYTTRRQGGHCLMEIMLASLFLPMTLFLTNLSAVVISQQTNNQLAKDAARAAADEGNASSALQAAQDKVSAAKRS